MSTDDVLLDEEGLPEIEDLTEPDEPEEPPSEDGMADEPELPDDDDEAEDELNWSWSVPKGRPVTGWRTSAGRLDDDDKRQADGKPRIKYVWLADPERYWPWHKAADNPTGWPATGNRTPAEGTGLEPYTGPEAAWWLHHNPACKPQEWRSQDARPAPLEGITCELCGTRVWGDPSVLTDEMARKGYSRWSNLSSQWVGHGDLRKRPRPYAKDSNVECFNDGADWPYAPVPWRHRPDPRCGCPVRGKDDPWPPCKHVGRSETRPLRPQVWWAEDYHGPVDDPYVAEDAEPEPKVSPEARLFAHLLDITVRPDLPAAEWSAPIMVEALDYLPADALETLVKAGKAERRNRPTETLAEALLWVSFVAHKLTHNGQVPATWGTLYVAEQVSLRWGQLVQSKDPRTPTQRLNEELRAVVIDYYRNRPGRLANLSAPGPKGTPFEGPALAVTALNAAIAVNRAAKPTVAWTTQRPYEGDFWTKAADVVSGEGNSESTWKRQDRQPWDAGEEIAREDALGVEEQLFGREDELPTTRERLTEVGVPEQDVETLLAWMLAYKATKDGQPIGVDWSFLRRRFDVGSIAVAQKKVRRARKRFVGLVRARLAPDDPAQRELDACVRDVQGRLAEPAKRPVPTVREVLLSYGVDLTAKPNKLGWVEVTCPWHESDRTRKGGAGWHPALNLYKCWHVDCLLPAGEALTAERLAFYLADEAA